MGYVLSGIAILYAVLSMLAAIVQLRTAKRKDTSAMMLGGGLMLGAGAALHLTSVSYCWMIAAAGGALICIAAFLNGKRGEAFHVSHHLIRLAVTVLLVVGFYLT